MSKIALVTGASAGLGRVFAELFAKDGHAVALVARRKERLEQLADDLRARHGVEAVVVCADLVEPGAPEQIVEAVASAGHAVEYLVNNAGFGSNGRFAEQDVGREVGMVQVNVTALVHLTGLILPQMLERGSGRILNVGSTAGFQPGPYMATYFATKAFVNHFTEALAFELRDTGVTATVSCPGPVVTEFGEVAGNASSNLFKGGAASADEVATEAYEAMMAGRPMVVHGVKNMAAVQALRLSPRAAVKRIAALLNRS